MIDTPYPEDLLFIEKSIYQHELPLEYALCCEQLGNWESFKSLLTSAATCLTACQGGLVSENETGRVLRLTLLGQGR